MGKVQNPRLLFGNMFWLDSDITLRDLFAGLAGAGYIAHKADDDHDFNTIARWSYEFATAMMYERSRTD